MDENKIFEENMKLINLVLFRYCHINNSHPEFEDLYQVGAIGLLKGIRNFKPELGFKFSTYATQAIFGEIRRHRRDNNIQTSVKISRTFKSLFGKYLKLQESGHSMKEMCSILDVTESQMNAAIQAMQTVQYLDEACEGDYNPLESLADDYSLENKFIENQEFKDKLNLFQSIMSEIQYKILCLRMSSDVSQRKIANQIGVSQVQVSRYLISANSIIETVNQYYEGDISLEEMLDECKNSKYCKLKKVS